MPQITIKTNNRRAPHARIEVRHDRKTRRTLVYIEHGTFSGTTTTIISREQFDAAELDAPIFARGAWDLQGLADLVNGWSDEAGAK
jgi:hypothetical protein